MGVALFWVLPEMVEFFGWPGAFARVSLGFFVLFLVDRFGYPLCPACSHTHEHEHCAAPLHGFATPLLFAAAIHSALDGWTMVAAQSGHFGPAFVLGIAIHKIPEGVALGIIARAALPSRLLAIGWCAVAQLATILGANFELLFAPYVSPHTLYISLAFVGGSFLYLGAHAVHGELRRSGPTPAFVPALTGVAGSSVLKLFVS
jgi:zinc transporter ZupT